MTFPRTNPRSPRSPRTTARLRMTALVALPVLALSVGCGGGDDGAGGTKKSDAIADVPDTPRASAEKDGNKADAPPAGKSAFYDAQLKYVQCMRVKGGYKDYPDPKLSGYLDWEKIEVIASKPGQNEAYKGGKDGVCAPNCWPPWTPSPSVTSRSPTSRCSRTPSACGTTASPGSPTRP